MVESMYECMCVCMYACMYVLANIIVVQSMLCVIQCYVGISVTWILLFNVYACFVLFIL